MATWQVRLVESSEDVAWDGLSAPSFYLSNTWLRATEGLLTDEHPYLVAEHDGVVAAVIACQLIRSPNGYAFYDPQELLFGTHRLAELRRWLSVGHAQRFGELAARLRIASAAMHPALVATAPRGYRSGVSYHHSLDESQRDYAARLLVDDFDELAASQGAATAGVLYLPEALDPHLERALRRRGYLSTLLDSDCYLDVEWGEFTGYLNHFSSSRRISLGADMRRFTNAGCTVEIGGAELLSDELAPLQAATQQRYGHPADPARFRRWFAKVKSELPGHARVCVARRGVSPIGFALFCESEGELYGRSAGFDYGHLNGECCYFNVVYYEPIRYAIATGLHRIYYGMEAYDAKLKRGCDLRLQRGWFRFSAEVQEPYAEFLRLYAEAQSAYASGLRRRYRLPLGAINS